MTQGLRRIRAQRQLTLRALSEISGVGKETISDIERGIRTPQTLTLGKLAAALDVDINDLLEDQYSPKARSRPSLEPPDSGDDGRRALYLTTVVEQARDMAGTALWMLNIESYGETPQELTEWSWRITGFLYRVWAMQQRWETRVFGPLSQQELPSWERSLLDEIREELEKAAVSAQKARVRFANHLQGLEDEKVRQAVEQLIESTRLPAKGDARHLTE